MLCVLLYVTEGELVGFESNVSEQTGYLRDGRSTWMGDLIAVPDWIGVILMPASPILKAEVVDARHLWINGSHHGCLVAVMDPVTRFMDDEI